MITEPCNEKVCGCPSGFEFASDKTTCVSTADADKHCPTSTCWTYENNPTTGKKECKLKLGFKTFLIKNNVMTFFGLFVEKIIRNPNKDR